MKRILAIAVIELGLFLAALGLGIAVTHSKPCDAAPVSATNGR